MLHRYASSALLCASSLPRSALRNDCVRLVHSTGQKTRSSELTPEPSLSGLGKGGRKQAWSQDRRTSWDDTKSVGSSSFSRSRPSDRGKPLTKGNLPRRIQRGSNADPYRTSAYVKELLLEGKFDDAVKLVEETSKEGLDVPVFNKLIHYAMADGRCQVAYSIYIEMKRRGFEPSIEVYTCMLQGWNNIPSSDWPRYSKQLEHCDAVYQAYREYLAAPKRQVRENSIVPIGYYLKVLGKTGQYQKMYDVLYSLDDEGPLAPGCSIYGAFFWALLERRSTEKLGNLTIDEQNAADAKLLWRQLEKDMAKRGFELTWYAAVPILRILARGRPSDHQLAIEIVRDYYGLAPPGETPSPPKAKLSWDVFQGILDMCNKLRKYRLCTYYAKQVMDNKIIVPDHYHMNQVLLAYHGLASLSPGDESHRAVDLIRRMLVQSSLDKGGNTKLRPSQSNYQIAFAICWRCEDWASACDIFTLMTGYQASDLLDETFKNGKKIERLERSEGRNMSLDPTCAAYLARAALASKDKAGMRQCLRMLTLFDWTGFFAKNRERHDHHPFYQNALASSIIKIVSTVIEEASSVEEKELWGRMRTECKEVAKRVLPQHVPELERTMSLRNSFSTHKVQQAIDFEMAARTS